jgi:DNA polymerase-3 subunit beta
MKFRVEAKPLATALGRLAGLVDGRATVPILSHVLLVAHDSAVNLTTTDLACTLSLRIEAVVEEAGMVAAPVVQLCGLARRLAAPAEIEAQEGKLLTLRSGRGRFRLPTLPPEDYPREPEPDKGAVTFSMPAADLLQLLDRTLFAAAVDPALRRHLCGVFLHTAGETLRAVTTDGHRLALGEAPLPQGAATIPGVSIPHKTAQLLPPLLAAAEEAAELTVGERLIRIAIGEACLTSKLIEGRFPEYERVIPTKRDTTILADAAPLAAAVERVALLCDGIKNHIVALTAEEGTGVTISATSILGGGEEEVEATLTGPGGRVAFNARYLLDALKRLPDTVSIEFADPSTPVVLRDPADDGALFVVTPCRA